MSIESLANEAREVWNMAVAPSRPLAEWCLRKIDDATAELRAERDALKAELARLKQPAPWTPKVGDVVKWSDERECVITKMGATRTHVGCAFYLDVRKFSQETFVNCEYVRPATPAERVAAGIDPAPVETARTGSGSTQWLPETPAPDLRALLDAVMDAVAEMHDAKRLLSICVGVKDDSKERGRVSAASARLDTAAAALVARLDGGK